ncbi:MAG: hypothetical protein Q8P41_16845 [Pseudomonadota bacterium]|nr:hypothetical protein [Pseudomonadota bacterium]
MPWVALLPAVLAAAALTDGRHELVVAAFAVPALLWLPGRGIARRLSRDPLERVVLAFWVSALLAVPAVLIGMWTGLGGTGTLAAAATFTAASERLAAPRARRVPIGPVVGALAVVVLVGGLAWSWRETIARPMDGYWWFAPAESAWSEGRATSPPTAGAGWRDRRLVGWPEAGAIRLVPRAPDPFLLGPAEGPLVVALQAPVGAAMRVGDQEVIVRSQVEESADEGPVQRYLARGVAAVEVNATLGAGQRLQIKLSQPAQSTVYLLAGPDAVWALDAGGALRFVHYYQLLNMVEQVVWARELYGDRRVTDVQPPLPSYVLAAPLAVAGGELPTANLVFLLELLMVGIAGVLAIRAWAPRAPALTWLLPAGAVAMHGKLLLEPASAMLPDTLYTLAVLGTVTTLARSRDRGAASAYAGFSLLAQLTRYPGGLVAAIAGLFAGVPRRVAAMLVLVLGVAGVFALAGRASGSLDGWMGTVWWETFPEHWHDEADPAVLLARAPRFYGLWLAYAGGLPILAALRWPRGTRVALGTALVYSLLLCTIDHTPPHYFLPLLQLSAVATACTAAAMEHPALRVGIPFVGLVGMGVAYGWMPIEG